MCSVLQYALLYSIHVQHYTADSKRSKNPLKSHKDRDRAGSKKGEKILTFCFSTSTTRTVTVGARDIAQVQGRKTVKSCNFFFHFTATLPLSVFPLIQSEYKWARRGPNSAVKAFFWGGGG